MIPWCEAHGVAVTAYSPFGHDAFPGPRSAGGRVLADIAQARGATPRQVALAFLVRRPSVFAIPKAASVGHVEENAGGRGFGAYAGRDCPRGGSISAGAEVALTADVVTGGSLPLPLAGEGWGGGRTRTQA